VLLVNVDPRGQRCNAALSAIVLAIVLITSSGWLLAAQAAVFGIGAVFGLRYSPYGYLSASASAARCTCLSNESGRAGSRWPSRTPTRRLLHEPL
jgi:hypothetical protein